MYETERQELCKREGEFSEEDLQEEEIQIEEAYTENQAKAVEETVEESSRVERSRTSQETGGNPRKPEKAASVFPAKDRQGKEAEKKRNEEKVDSANVPVRLFCFVSDYCMNPGKEIAAAARERDLAVGLVLMLLSVCLSALGTLIFGALYLEDFLLRWVTCGIIVPLLAYGFSLLYGKAYVALSPVGKCRSKENPRGIGTFGELFSVITTASMGPNLILLLSCALSPLDKNLRLFQFFALLLTVVWIVSLLLTLFTVYGGEISLGGIILTVLFAFLAFVAMRTIWVWYLTGEFRFTLYVPLSVFME